MAPHAFASPCSLVLGTLRPPLRCSVLLDHWQDSSGVRETAAWYKPSSGTVLHSLRGPSSASPKSKSLSAGGKKPSLGGAPWEKRQFILSLTLQRSKWKAALMQRSRSMLFPHGSVMKVRTRHSSAEPAESSVCNCATWARESDGRALHPHLVQSRS